MEEDDDNLIYLDFFLTRPYLRLTIDERHDVIAFVGLARSQER